MNWFYESGGQQQGPVSDDDLDRLLAEGRLQPETLVWREGLADWQPLRSARGDTGAAGSPGTERCASCGQYFPLGELVQIGGRSICPACKPAVLLNLQQGGTPLDTSESERTGPAWENREALGFFPAIWQTVQQALTEPSACFSNMRREGGILQPFFYFLLLSASSGIFANIAFGVFRLLTGFQTTSNAQLPPGFAFLSTPYFNFVMAGVVPFGAAIAPFIGAGILHVSLMLCKGAPRPFETTFRVYCYSVGSASVIQFIPICGAYVAWIWALVIQCIGIARAQEINTGRAVLAVLLPIIVIFCAMFAFIAIFVGIGITAINQHH